MSEAENTTLTQMERHMLYLRDIIMRQTDYDEETADKKLEEHNKDVIAVIREYMGAPSLGGGHLLEKTPVSTNQAIYGEIRTMMDDAAASYRVKKELEERREAAIAAIQQARAQAAANLRESTEAVTTKSSDDKKE